ncbi:MAG TPA: uracil-DNA glycosylase [Armatimonadetes bacterium]|jgi:DNA polymerase|nr:uracil-DNA glycosylase [Armatimonadota bacterium]
MLDRRTKEQLLSEIAAEVRACTRCPLHATRNRAVPGSGDPDARVMLIGEAPGYYEDQQGLPFVGAAGQLLDRLLARAGLVREEVFIANILKCRPPKNRDPGDTERAACAEYLDAQIGIIQPCIICLLGRVPLQALIDPDASVTRIHGSRIRKHGMLWIPLFHPAAALHQPHHMPALETDFDRLADALRDVTDP